MAVSFVTKLNLEDTFNLHIIACGACLLVYLIAIFEDILS